MSRYREHHTQSYHAQGYNQRAFEKHPCLPKRNQDQWNPLNFLKKSELKNPLAGPPDPEFLTIGSDEYIDFKGVISDLFPTFEDLSPQQQQRMIDDLRSCITITSDGQVKTIAIQPAFQKRFNDIGSPRWGVDLNMNPEDVMLIDSVPVREADIVSAVRKNIREKYVDVGIAGFQEKNAPDETTPSLELTCAISTFVFVAMVILLFKKFKHDNSFAAQGVLPPQEFSSNGEEDVENWTTPDGTPRRSAGSTGSNSETQDPITLAEQAAEIVMNQINPKIEGILSMISEVKNNLDSFKEEVDDALNLVDSKLIALDERVGSHEARLRSLYEKVEKIELEIESLSNRIAHAAAVGDENSFEIGQHRQQIQKLSRRLRIEEQKASAAIRYIVRLSQRNNTPVG